jgi:hypothetical protein
MRALAVAVAATLVLAACATAPTVAPDPRDAVLALLAGSWDNRAQFDAAPASLKTPPSVEGDWLDLQHAQFMRVAAPSIGEHVLYLEWRNGSADGAISRQRIWSFRREQNGALRMDFFAFVDGKPFAGRGSEPGAFSALDAAQLRGYGSACALRFEPTGQGGWRGLISADECSLVAASGRRMGIDASIAVDADGTLAYRESGRLDDGRYAFRVPPSMPYRFRRLP